MTQADKSNWIPLLLWSYIVATAPWLIMLSKDDSLSSILAVFFCELFYARIYSKEVGQGFVL